MPCVGRASRLPTLGVSLLWFITLPASLRLAPLEAQTPPDVAAEREAYARWLAGSPTSPWAAIALAPIGGGLRLGPPSADIPLEGLSESRIVERQGRPTLESGSGARPLPRGRPALLGPYTVVASGSAGRFTVSVFGRVHPKTPPAYFSYDPAFAVFAVLEPPSRPGTVRVLAPDGTEVEATEAGTIAVKLGATVTRLAVRRLPGDPDESDLEIYFRDATSGHGTYPAGRFVTLLPQRDGRYLVDFNRARNPFCAYSSAYPCPAPWSGNTLAAQVRAGERYEEGAK